MAENTVENGFVQLDFDSNLMMQDAKLTVSDYAQVLFMNVVESYPADADVQCTLKLTEFISAGCGDWVGLFRVGWTSIQDYVCYQLAEIPSDYKQGREITMSVVFKSDQLPIDNGDFYQFCYVTSRGMVRGASIPFQIRDPCSLMEQLVTVEDEDHDMMVIKTRSSALQEELEKIENEKVTLMKKIENLQSEREGLVDKLVFFQRELTHAKDENADVMKIQQELEEEIRNLKVEAMDMKVLREALGEQMNKLIKENVDYVKQLGDCEDRVKELDGRLRSLLNEKDALEGHIKQQTEEKNMLQDLIAASEGHAVVKMGEIEALKSEAVKRVEEIIALEQELSKREEMLARQCVTLEQLDRTVDDGKATMKELATSNEVTKHCLAQVEEQLQNCEDMLQAAESCKEILSNEIDSLQLAYNKVSTDWEQCKSEVHNLKMQLKRVEEISARENEQFSAEKNELVQRVEASEQEKLDLEGELEVLRSKLCAREEEKIAAEEGPLFALKMAHEQLRDRLVNVQKENQELRKQLDRMTKEKEENLIASKSSVAEIVDLKNRLRMGEQAFQEKYIQCRDLEKEMRKTQKRNALAKSTSASIFDGDSLVDLSNEELRTHLQQVGADLESRATKIQKYKTLYEQEREKSTLLQQTYYENLETIKADRDCLRVKLALALTQQAPEAQEFRYHKFSQIRVNNTSDIPPILHPPLTPLPPPITPVLLPSAKVAAIKATIGVDPLKLLSRREAEKQMNVTWMQFADVEDSSTTDGDEGTQTLAPTADGNPCAEEDRFEDAIEEPQQMPGVCKDDEGPATCPFCYVAFPPGIDMTRVYEHVESHTDRECPVCCAIFGVNETQQKFEDHVQTHIKD